MCAWWHVAYAQVTCSMWFEIEVALQPGRKAKEDVPPAGRARTNEGFKLLLPCLVYLRERRVEALSLLRRRAKVEGVQ